MIDIIIAASIGLGLASACGFRVFVPMLVIGLAGRGDYLTLSDGFGWLESWPAIGAFAVATALEIGAYYFPWLDNLLDSISTPAAVVAGVITSTAVAHQDMNPMLKWSLGIIAGGGSAGIVKLGFTALRAGATATTAGLANPVVSTLEWIGSFIMSVLAVFLPILAGILAIVSVVVGATFVRKLYIAWRGKKKASVEETPEKAAV